MFSFNVLTSTKYVAISEAPTASPTITDINGNGSASCTGSLFHNPSVDTPICNNGIFINRIASVIPIVPPIAAAIKIPRLVSVSDAIMIDLFGAPSALTTENCFLNPLTLTILTIIIPMVKYTSEKRTFNV